MDRTSFKKRVFNVFRYDPTTGGDGHFDRFELDIEDESKTTVLDALLRIQREHDLSLAFRYACRVNMCGSCGMVINGQEGLACKTVIADLRGKEIDLRPLNHFPVVKDLVVDMDPFFEKYQEAMPYFEALEDQKEPSIIPPDSRERKAIGLSTECIACGCCVSSCTMAHWHKDYMGPAALNRAFTLLADSRDGMRVERLARAMDACYNCRLELNCTEVCPKEISPTRAIKYIQRMAAKGVFKGPPTPLEPEGEKEIRGEEPVVGEPWSRRRFLSMATVGISAAAGLFIGGLLTAGAFAPALRSRTRQWVRVGGAGEFMSDREGVKTVQIRYQVEDGFYKNRLTKPVMVSRIADPSGVVVFNSRCTHLGCTVHWDEAKKLFVCACHGGAFYPDGRVKAGPPPRPLVRYRTKVEDGQLFVLEA
ncbi:MAG: succinate dehydrogenase iron-sulfur subunit [Deltaproteobacteria bacterium]|nr:succinate dehydrogenase iron-sulfur subunit [Deltaproteobacteria bacterium]